MSLYTETLLKREENEKKLENEANQALKDKKYTYFSSDPLDEIQVLLSMVLEHYHYKPETVRGCKTVEELLESTLDARGIMYQEIDLSNKVWKKSNCYILAFEESGVPLLLKPKIFGYSWVSAGSVQATRLTKKMILKNKAFIIFPPLQDNVKNLWGFVKYTISAIPASSILGILGIALIVSLTGMLIPAINKWVLYDFLKQTDKNYGLFFGALTAFLVVGLLNAFLNSFKNRLHSTTSIIAASTVQKGFMARILMFPYSFFRDTSSGTLTRYLKNASALTGKIITIILGTTVTFVFSFVYIPQMFSYAGPEIALIALSALVIEFVVSFLIAMLTAKNDRLKLQAQNEAANIQFSTIKGIQKIKGIGAERRFYARWAKSYRKFLNLTQNPPLAIKLSTAITMIITTSASILIYIMAVPVGIGKGVDVGMYIAFNSAFGYVSTAVTHLSTTIKDFISLRPLVKELQPIFETTNELSTETEYVHSLTGNIKVEHVSFSYEKDGKKILDDINLNFKAGEKIAIVGESGCGKSTFVKILLGLCELTNGCIYYDGFPITTLDASSLRRHITSVCQFHKLFPGTIFENLTIGNQNLTEEEAWKACEKAAISERIKELPLGLETEISESISCGFSGGERQRLMLARAFASKNNIMILDEATSALDNQAQAHVLESIYASKCTVIMVAHRLSTVVNCDRILVFDKGKVVEDGNYEQLMKLDGMFANLMRKQQLGDSDNE